MSHAQTWDIHIFMIFLAKISLKELLQLQKG